jgi:hypothetical protein
VLAKLVRAEKATMAEAHGGAWDVHAFSRLVARSLKGKLTVNGWCEEVSVLNADHIYAVFQRLLKVTEKEGTLYFALDSP